MSSSPSAEGAASAAAEAAVCVGTWNMSHWMPGKAHIIATEIGAAVLALQETHLAAFPLECAHDTARRVGLHLHHGHPARALAGTVRGQSCGVGFVAAKGVAVSPVVPKGAAWRQLYGMGRLHAVLLAARPGLPHGLLMFSVYAPLQQRSHVVQRAKFVAAMVQLCSELDMQVPTLIFGDFNGSVDPEADFLGESSKKRAPCPLLEQLLGPGAAWVDVQRALSPEVSWTYRNTDAAGHLWASRIDLVLANHAAMARVQSTTVLERVADGGHSPVLVQLQLAGPIAVSWQRPKPRVPVLLQAGSTELVQSPEWEALLERWMASPELKAVLSPLQPHTGSSLSSALAKALQGLVRLAGGWVLRPRARRQAYDSSALRGARRTLADLLDLCRQLRRVVAGSPGCWPLSTEQLLRRLAEAGFRFSRSSAASTVAEVEQALAAQRGVVARITGELRAERYRRWKDSRAALWRDRPGVVYNWLQAAGAPWGSTPILDGSGMQCLSVAAVDAAVRGYWVDDVLRQHAGVDPVAQWAAFVASEFGAFVPRVSWPTPPWTGERVLLVLRSMRENAAPGLFGLPLAVWKVMPPTFLDAVAQLLTLVEAEGVWPPEWTEAYVAMIPKASGGTRPRDQRPITVLEVLYRVWAKGVVMAWRPAMQGAYLGQAAMGFRAGAGTLHVAQLLADLIRLQRQRRKELWLASFDVEKCYDSVPWWAMFGVMRAAGISDQVVGCFEAFYTALRRRFRYGQVEGETWQATNGLAQGCPASPDLLNLLLEPFHRWALAQDVGVEVQPGCRVPSVSFADDVALVATSRRELEVLVAAYLRWCSLLGLRVTKVQAWSSVPGQHELSAMGTRVTTTATFKIVGVVLGANEGLATQAHLEPRLSKAVTTARRLRYMEMPASVCALLWKVAVLPQALYGCEVRDVRPTHLTALVQAGRNAVQGKAPIHLNGWRAEEVLHGPPLGESAVQNPVLEMRIRQLRWLRVLVNLPSIVGLAHRVVAGMQAQWQEPPGALASALQAVGWKLRRNAACHQAQAWPVVVPETGYPGQVVLQPVDSFPVLNAVFTDGSVMRAGGAAAVMPDEDVVAQVQLSQPRSSTHCELTALGLAMQLSPPQILTDSLASLYMLRGWQSWSVERRLRCPDRREVRWVLSLATLCELAPVLEKVKAHDEALLRLGHPKAVGNDRADAAARRAATESDTPRFEVDLAPFADAVSLLDAAGRVVDDVEGQVSAIFWERRQTSRSKRRAWLDKLYPLDVAINWELSTGVFRRPVVSGRAFVHPVPPAVVKWLARTRAGCLPASTRLFTHGLDLSAVECPCCGATVDDEEHMVSGCAVTGSADWLPGLLEVWRMVAQGLELEVDPPPESFFHCFRLPLLVGVIPEALVEFFPAALAREKVKFLRRFHAAVAAQLAEWLGRREAIRAVTAPAQSSAEAPQAARPHGLPPERQLRLADLRRLEVERRAAPLAPQPSPPPSGEPAAPPSGVPRQRWLRARLERLLLEETDDCTDAQASSALEVLALFETVTKEVFADTPGVTLKQRVSAMGKVMSNITRQVTFTPPLRQLHSNRGGSWTRRARRSLDAQAWKAAKLAEERYQAPTLRLSEQVVEANLGLAAWIRDHPYLESVAVEDGESVVALLILWEVDHQREFPRGGGEGLPAALMGFTRRLKHQIAEDAELQAWLVCKSMQRRLSQGLPASHHTYWSVRVKRPAASEPQGWYEEFMRRWQAHLEGLALASLRLRRPAAPTGSEAVSSSSTASMAAGVEVERNAGLTRRRQPVQRPRPVESTAAAAAKRRRSAGPAPQPGTGRRRAREEVFTAATLPPAEEQLSRSPAAMPLERLGGGCGDHRALAAMPLERLGGGCSGSADTAVDAVRDVVAEDVGRVVEPSPKRRRADLRNWLVPVAARASSSAGISPRAAAAAGHGRAVQAPPT